MIKRPGNGAAVFKKLLIANRGEVALRVLRTCRRLGIAAATVHSEADATAPHATEAAETHLIGPPPAAQSYLNVPAILDAARKAGADALHPGYGFLSENAEFARACAAAGLTFIGPRPDAMAAMATKVESRALATAAGVPVVPGGAAVPDPDAAAATAAQLGYPVLIKPSAGGGGIGSVVAPDEAALRKAFAGAQQRAAAYFGDGTLYLERYLARPRHIEVQLVGDRHGNLFALGERECSIQRRFQKVIEETPSPAVDPPLRAHLCDLALAIGRAIAYDSIGTVEFLMDADRNVYFLEMNTRLQVEHPITELVTGLDLVELQIRAAAGEEIVRSSELGARSSAPEFRAPSSELRTAHAIEARVYAEDPVRFLPSPGTLTAFEPPAGPGVRVDRGVAAGYTMTPYYDPLLAKVSAAGETRVESIVRLDAALVAFRVEGVKTNLPALRAALADPGFRAGEYSTETLLEMVGR
jgi:acetyl-CoA carboxylase biotin carboxylase subunit